VALRDPFPRSEYRTDNPGTARYVNAKTAITNGASGNSTNEPFNYTINRP
jgi:hypothetical protein